MVRRVLTFSWLILLAAVFSPTVGSGEESLTFGVPVRLLPGAHNERSTLDRIVDRLTAPLRCSKPDCEGGPTELRLGVALGTDYEILDWFGKGLLDAAIVPEVSAFLLRDEGLRFGQYLLATGGS